MIFRRFIVCAGLAATVGLTADVTRSPCLHLVGDSTMADKPVSPPNPEHGWGQMLPVFFKDPARVVNHAINGFSTRSFREEGHWAAVLAQLRPGDFVLIQFAHNDEKIEDPKRYAAPETDFQENLRRFVREARDRGANPLLATPVARRRWNQAGTLVETHGAYPAAMRAVAATEKVPLLDLNALTRQLEFRFGPEGSKRLHLWIPAGAYDRAPQGLQDDTHYSALGATEVAKLAVREIDRLQLPLARWIDRSVPTTPGD